MAQTSKAQKPSNSNPNRRDSKVGSSRSRQLRRLLRRKSGASIAELQEKFGWQPHTARAAISGLRKGGETIERCAGVAGSIYRIVEVSGK